MDARDLYAWLMQGKNPGACSGFDAHVLACVLALAVVEAEGDGQALLDALGLERSVLLSLLAEHFPGANPLFERNIPGDAVLSFESDELCLRDLFSRFRSDQSALQECLGCIVARRCQRPNHLWQDLGLRNRRELSWLMERHFGFLFQKNQGDMKWKKFLYRTICRDDGFSICTSPSCAECDDFEDCFGDEGGESLLAKARRSAELGSN